MSQSLNHAVLYLLRAGAEVEEICEKLESIDVQDWPRDVVEQLVDKVAGKMSVTKMSEADSKGVFL